MTAVEDVLADPAAADLDEIRVAREDPVDLGYQVEVADLGCRGYPVALEDPVVPVVLAAPEAVPPEEVPLVVAAAVAAAVEEVDQVHPLHRSLT